MKLGHQGGTFPGHTGSKCESGMPSRVTRNRTREDGAEQDPSHCSRVPTLAAWSAT